MDQLLTNANNICYDAFFYVKLRHIFHQSKYFKNVPLNSMLSSFQEAQLQDNLLRTASSANKPNAITKTLWQRDVNLFQQSVTNTKLWKQAKAFLP